MRKLSDTFFECTTAAEIDGFYNSISPLAGAIPTKRLKPSKHQAPSGLKPVKKDPKRSPDSPRSGLFDMP
jgi:hypothetical protein